MPEPLRLEGCTPEPLMGYLKALGVLRLLSEQLPNAAVRGWWDGGVFFIQSSLTEKEVCEFFLNDYRPTPLIAPWGARSGFYPDSSEASARKALEAIAKSPDDRLTPFKEAITAVRGLLDRLGFQEKAEDEDKLRLMQACRAELPDHLLEWLDAVYVLTTNSRSFPPLLGTGGNEGSGSYVSGFAQMVVEAIVKKRWDHAFGSAVFATPVRKAHAGQTPGHFSPGQLAGVNPWDFLLSLEGCCLWASGLVRRAGMSSPSGVAAFPFTVQPVGAGGPALCGRDEVKPKKVKRDPAELWLPLWDQPARLTEIRNLFAEGRASLGRAKARTGLDFALAATNLGVDRGIRAFQRFVFLPRNGPLFFATSLGKLNVEHRPESMLVEQVRGWLDDLRVKCRSDSAPARFGSAVRRIDAAIFEFCKYGSPERLADILAAIGRAERELAVGDLPPTKRWATPLGGLSSEWLTASNDGSVEYRLARAVASIRSPIGGKVPSLRANLEPVVPVRRGWAWIGSEEAQRGSGASREGTSRSVVWSGGSLAGNFGAVLVQRLLEAEKAGEDLPPLSSSSRATLADVARFLHADTDDGRLEDLVWGCTLVSQADEKSNDALDADIYDAEPLPREYALLKLTLLPGRIAWAVTPEGTYLRYLRLQEPEGVRVRAEPGMLSRLRAGDVAGACELAVRRLRVAGFSPLPGLNADGSQRNICGEFATDATRLLASLLIPITDTSVNTLGQMVLRRPTADVPA